MTATIRILLALGLLALTACQSAPRPMPQGPYVEATRAAEPEGLGSQEPLVVGVPYPVPVPAGAKPTPPTAPTPEQIEQAKREKRSPKEVMDEANALARQAPTPEGFTNATLVYDYMPGALYQVWGAPNHLTAIEFAPGEQVYSFAAGDTVRWLVVKTYSGSKADRRTLLLLEPVRRGLHTSMVITTSKGTYHIELKSFQHSFLAGVSFRHPRQRLIELAQQRAIQHEQAKAEESTQRATLAVSLDELEDRYTLVSPSGDLPRWAPRRVFNDGKRTYIDFGNPLGGDELPALFVLTRQKSTRVVQYTVKGRYMIVGELVEAAVLRLGDINDGGEEVGIELMPEAKEGHR